MNRLALIFQPTIGRTCRMPFQRIARTLLCLFGWIWLACLPCWATDWFVSTSGNDTNAGTIGAPWGTAAVLNIKSNIVQAGDNLFFRAGTYDWPTPFTNTTLFVALTGTSNNPIVIRSYTNELAKLRLWTSSLQGGNNANWLTIRDLEISGEKYISNVSTQVSTTPSDIQYHNLVIYNGVTGIKMINNFIHDGVGEGASSDAMCTNMLFYGNLLWNFGWRDTNNNGYGHCVYFQNDSTPSWVLQNNVLFNSANQCIQLYGTAAHVKHFLVQDHVSVNAGVIANYAAHSAEFTVQADAGNCDDIIITNLMTYATTNNSAVLFGNPSASNNAFSIWSSYIPERMVIANFHTLSVTNNTLFKQIFESVWWFYGNVNTNQVVGTWDYNVYHNNGGGTPFFTSPGGSYTFPQWQGIPTTISGGLDPHSTFDTSAPATIGNRTFVIPNAYEGGRATIVCYNWSQFNTIGVQLASVLNLGDTYQVYNAQDYFHGPLMTKIYDGNLVYLPQTNLTVAPVLGGLYQPAPTGPTYNVFIVRRIPSMATTFLAYNAQDYLRGPIQSATFSGGVLTLPQTNLTVAPVLGGLFTPAVTGPKFNVFLAKSLLIPIGQPALPQFKLRSMFR